MKVYTRSQVWSLRFGRLTINSLAVIVSVYQTTYALLDTNNNGVSDIWEKIYNNDQLFTAFDPAADPDGDGWTNEVEAVSGTNPFDSNSNTGFVRPQITHTPAVYITGTNGEPEIITPEVATTSWPVIAGKKYVFLGSPNLDPESWIAVDNFVSDGSSVSENVQITQSDGSRPDRLFWRVAATDVDTDIDTLTDAEEFTLGTSTTNSDTDEDGLGDSAEVIGGTNPQEQHSDQDGIPDGVDVAPKDTLVNWAKEDPFLFAQFPVVGQGWPINVNDQGRVLFNDSVWSNGVSHALSLVGVNLRECHPRSIGDNGFILGTGEIDLPGDDDPAQWDLCHVTWPGLDASPIPLRVGGNYAAPHFLNFTGSRFASEVMTGDQQINSNGEFVALLAAKTSSEVSGKTYYHLEVVTAPEISTLNLYRGMTGSGDLALVKSVPGRSVFAPDSDHIVTWGEDGIFSFGASALPEHYNRIIKLPDGRFAAFSGYGPKYDAIYPLIQNDTSWVSCETLGRAVDFATDMKITAEAFWRIYHNGRNEKMEKKNPGLVPVWNSEFSCRMADISLHGWTLETQLDGANVTTMLGAPLALGTGGAATGLDNLSATAVDNSFDKPQERIGNKDEFWAMVPAGGTIQFNVKSPATPETPLVIGTSASIGATPSTINSQQVVLTLSAPLTAAGTEHAVPFKIGNIASGTTPLKAKVMKPRVINLSVWPLQRPAPHSGTMPAIPTKGEIEGYLNGIFKPQLNVTLNVTIKDSSVIASDPGVKFNVADPPTSAQQDIAAPRSAGNLQVFVLGSYDEMFASGPFSYGGWTNPAERYIWVSVGALKGTKPENEKKENWLNTVAHEVGHVLLGAGHPDDSSKPGPAALPGTNRRIRLMFSGFLSNAPPANRRWLVKAEWDMAEGNLIEMLNNL